jgi:phage terminase large subunit-like protein
MSQQPSNASPALSFALLNEADRNRLLSSLATEAGVTVEQVMALLAWKWEGWLARPSQLEPTGDWLYWIVKAGRGFGKTRIGAEWVRRQVQRYPRVGLIGKDAADMRSVMIEGESGILAVCPPHERPVYSPSTRTLAVAERRDLECRTGEDPEGVRGVQFDRLWCDEIAAWQYPQETWDMALLALRLGDDPRVCVTTTPKPIRLSAT